MTDSKIAHLFDKVVAFLHAERAATVVNKLRKENWTLKQEILELKKQRNELERDVLRRTLNSPVGEFITGQKVVWIPDGKVYDYGYISQTGKVILYEVGERNMQDSFAVDADDVKLAKG